MRRSKEELREEVRSLRAMLVRLEWSGSDAAYAEDSWSVCPECDGVAPGEKIMGRSPAEDGEHEGHHEGCLLAREVRLAAE